MVDHEVHAGLAQHGGAQPGGDGLLQHRHHARVHVDDLGVPAPVFSDWLVKGHRVHVPAPHAALAHVSLAAGHEAGHLHVAVRGAHLAHHLATSIIIQTRYRVALSLSTFLKLWNAECGS